MKRLFVIIAILLLPMYLFAEDIYIAQNSAGGDTGADCANSHSAAWFNTAGNWGSDAGDITAGDIAHLCGTISTALTVQGSGTDGNIITIKFEDDAKLSKNTWGASGAAVTISSKSYILIDGGTNGIIEATDNGTALTYQDDQRGVYISNGTEVEIKNLTINNLFVRTPGTGGAFGSNGIRAEGTSTTLSIHHNTCNYMNSCVYVAYGGTSSWVLVYNNTFNHGANGMVFGNNGASSLTNLQVYNNTVNLYDDSSDATCGNTFHNDGLQFFAQTAGSSITDMKVYGNTIGPNMGICTATTGWIFVEGIITGSKVYNNLLLNGSGVVPPTNGYIYDKPWSGGTKATEIYNNTIIGDSQGGTGVGAEEEGSIIKNNILTNLNYGIYQGGSSTISNNLFFNNDTNGTTGTNPVLTNPTLDGSYIPQAGSPAIDAGLSIASLFTTDKAGTSRPQGAAWDIGAYEYASGGDSTAPVVTAFVIPATATSLTVDVSSFTCTDAVGVTGYCVTSVNNSSGCSWAGSAQTTITFTSSGSQTGYGWCKDAADNISNSSSDGVVITLSNPSITPGSGPKHTPGSGAKVTWGN